VVRHIEDVESLLGYALYAYAPKYTTPKCTVDLILSSGKEFYNMMFIQGWLAGVCVVGKCGVDSKECSDTATTTAKGMLTILTVTEEKRDRKKREKEKQQKIRRVAFVILLVLLFSFLARRNIDYLQAFWEQCLGIWEKKIVDMKIKIVDMKIKIQHSASRDELCRLFLHIQSRSR